MKLLLSFLFLLLAVRCLSADVTAYRIGRGTLEEGSEQAILKLEGTPYKIGLQHGTLLKDKIQCYVKQWIESGKLEDNPRFKMCQEKLPKLLLHLPPHYMEEMKGIAVGSGLPFEKIFMLNLLPDMFHCMGLTVQGESTTDNALYHGHVFDDQALKGFEPHAILMIVKKEGKCGFVSIGYPGLVGSVVGMNDEKISVSEVEGDGSGEWEGIPMPFLIREILENARSLEEAKTLLEGFPRTSEYCYVLADGNREKVLGAYATAHQLCWIEPGVGYALMNSQKLAKNGRGHASNDKLFMGHFSSVHSEFQSRFYDDEGELVALFNQQPKHCLILKGFQQFEHYSMVAEHVRGVYGKLNVNHLQEMVKHLAYDAPLRSVILHPATSKLWVSHVKKGEEPAVVSYTLFDLKTLLTM